METKDGFKIESEQNKHNQSAIALLDNIKVFNGSIFPTIRKDSQLGEKWKVKTVHQWLLTAGNFPDGLFAKAFLPAALPFAQASYDAALELSALELSTKILKPLNLHKDPKGAVILFPLGNEVKTALYEELYSKSERKQITSILIKHNLISLPPSVFVPLIEVNDTIHSADIFNDSQASIELFNR